MISACPPDTSMTRRRPRSAEEPGQSVAEISARSISEFRPYGRPRAANRRLAEFRPKIEFRPGPIAAGPEIIQQASL